jgi:hypothetical protein
MSERKIAREFDVYGSQIGPEFYEWKICTCPEVTNEIIKLREVLDNEPDPRSAGVEFVLKEALSDFHKDSIVKRQIMREAVKAGIFKPKSADNE